MKSVILRLVQGTPSRCLACSYVTLPRKAKLLACPPQTCLFLPNIAGKRTLTSSYLQMYCLTCRWNNYLKLFSPNLLTWPLQAAAFLLPILINSSLVTLLDTAVSWWTPMTVFLPISGRQNNNYIQNVSLATQ